MDISHFSVDIKLVVATIKVLSFRGEKIMVVRKILEDGITTVHLQPGQGKVDDSCLHPTSLHLVGISTDGELISLGLGFGD